MQIKLLLAACLLGIVSGETTPETLASSPPEENTCNAEMDKMRECSQIGTIDLRHWDKPGFEKNIPLFTNWLQCIGETKCSLVQKVIEKAQTKFEGMLHFNKHLSTCLGNNALVKFSMACSQEFMNTRNACEDTAYLDCVAKRMEKHEKCTLKDVKTYQDYQPQLIRYCTLKQEIHELKKQRVIKLG
ncbi:hypothetical protein CAEBREN_19933 [Caenorhabditis brenneri]|uniref:DUF19 domain-containing protein n=1 Tax=Caenorhabditis brenneri TaxID=135651 RepID=G0NNP2_CAEBE|nr:hypothetical protein CAEBREN_19933 [Caenorhabditis brenneri]